MLFEPHCWMPSGVSFYSERRGLASYQVAENSILLSRNMSRWCMGHCWNLCQPISSKWPFEWLEFSQSIHWNQGRAVSLPCVLLCVDHVFVVMLLVAIWICWVVHHFGSHWNTSKNMGWIAKEFWPETCGPGRMNPADFGHPLTSPLQPPVDDSYPVKYLKMPLLCWSHDLSSCAPWGNYLMDCLEIRYPCCPQD